MPNLRLAALGVVCALASLAVGGSPSSAAKPAAVPRVAEAPTPQRLVDTRSGQRVTPGAVLRVAVPAATAAGANAVTVNVTATDAQRAGYVTAWPCAQAMPATSVLNFGPGHPEANLVVVDYGGEICFDVSAPVHLVVDQMGWFTGSTEFRGMTPTRLLDTRQGAIVQPFVPVVLDGTGRPGFSAPSSAVMLNVTVTQTAGDGYVVAYPCGAVPGNSTVNFRAGEDVAALTVVPPAGGKVCFVASTPVHLVVDAFGWVPSGGALKAQAPARMLDTRQASWPYGAAQSGSTLTVQVSGRGGIPNSAAAAMLTVTAVDTSSSGYLTVWPCDDAMPGTSIVNTWNGSLRANLAFVRLSAAGTVCVQAHTDAGVPVHVIVDAVAHTTGGPNRANPPAQPVPPTTPVPPVVPPPSGAGGTHFVTLPPGTPLPSGDECASRVRAVAENRPDNSGYNSTTWSSQPIDFPLGTRADGRYKGTTDQILQWVACKWGIDEDIVRAQVAKESAWHQNVLGDRTGNNCAPVTPQTNPCGESIGLMQVRWAYHQPAFEGSVKSSAYNVDYAYAAWRSCYEGHTTWLNSVERGRQYAGGDVWGCVGLWFAGRWYTDPATTYIGAVQAYLTDRVWERAEFANW